MMSGKSLAMIRAACSVTAGTAAASLGHETLPLSIQTGAPAAPKTATRRHFLSTPERPRSPNGGGGGVAAAAAAALTTAASSSTTTPTAEEWIPFSPSLPLPSDADRLDTFNNAIHAIYDGANHATNDNGNLPAAGARATSDAGCGAEDARDAASSSVYNSVKYWAQLFKTFNGLYGGTASGDEGAASAPTKGGAEVGGGAGSDAAAAAAATSREDESASSSSSSSQKCRFCQSVPSNFALSPTSFKNSTLNTVTASRHLFLVRHGQYHNTRKLERDRCLTRVGREQLRLTGDRLREIGASYSRIVASTMKRAQESAQIILKCIGNSDLPFGSDALLEEGAPIVPEPPLPNWKPNKKQYQTDGERIETAFRKYFRKADITHSNDINEVIVCHANVIRYFVCRALEVQPEAWLRMWLNHGSITWLTIKPSGRVVLNAMGASGYMPPSRLTAT